MDDKAKKEVIFKYSRKRELEHFSGGEGLAPYEAGMVAQYFNPGEKLLDIGCGAGREARSLAAAGYLVTAIDLAPEMIEAAKKLDPDGSTEYLVGDGAELQFEDRRFDSVLLTGQLIDHMPGRQDRQNVFCEAFRVLRPGGRAILSFYNNIYRPGPHAAAWWLARGLKYGPGSHSGDSFINYLSRASSIAVMRFDSGVRDSYRRTKQLFGFKPLAPPGWRRIGRISPVESAGRLWHYAPPLAEIKKDLIKSGFEILRVEDVLSFRAKPTPRIFVGGAYCLAIAVEKPGENYSSSSDG